MKKTIVAGVILSITIFLLIITFGWYRDDLRKNVFVDEEQVKYIAKVDNQYFYLYQDNLS